MKKTLYSILCGTLVICILFVGYLYFNNKIGVGKVQLKLNVTSLLDQDEDWIVSGEVSDTLAAYIMYSEDMKDFEFSIFVNRPGLSFGYFSHSGERTIAMEESIAEFTIDGYTERAFISMNRQNVKRVVIEDVNNFNEMDINSEAPFVIILPVDSGKISFYDADGNKLDYVNCPL